VLVRAGVSVCIYVLGTSKRSSEGRMLIGRNWVQSSYRNKLTWRVKLSVDMLTA
jgi:hypothetical protein